MKKSVKMLGIALLAAVLCLGSGQQAKLEAKIIPSGITAGAAEMTVQKGSVTVEKRSAKAETKLVNKLPDYTVAALEQPKTMYATSAVNVRKGPGTAFGKIGGLKRAQEVTVTGQADTGWYEISFGEGKAFVSDKYLASEKPAVQAAAQAQAGAGVVMVGDSRFVEMQTYAGENSCVWIAERGKGYKWLEETAMPSIDGAVGKGSKVLINLGVNDPGNHQKYIELINAKAEEWVGKGAKVYYSSVNPVWENPHVTKEQVEYFNSQLVSGLSGNVQWIDSYSYLDSIGYKLVDGLHFNAETYQNLYAYYMGCL